jgi:hypothetical protein
MKYRKLRVVWSVPWGVACVLFLVLWIRSYYRRDVVAGNVAPLSFVAESAQGQISVWHEFMRPGFETPWGHTSYGLRSRGFGLRIDDKFFVTDWSVFLLLVFLAAVPWADVMIWKPKRVARSQSPA